MSMNEGRLLVIGTAAAVILSSAAAAAVARLNTKITSGPSGLTASTTATFKFKATASRTTFEC